MKNKGFIHLLIFSILMLLSISIFYQIYIKSDLLAHNNFCIRFLNGEDHLPVNFLYFLLLSVFAFFNPENVKIASLLLLSAFVFFKYYVSYLYIKENEKENTNFIYAFLAFTLVLTSAIYLPNLFFIRMYHGSFPPNVWHNSTVIAVMPFSLILFWQTVKQLKNFSWKRLLIISLLILINLLIKPSFLFVYVGALPLTFLLYKGFKKEFFLQIIPVFICIVLIYIQTNLIFTPEKGAGIAIKPFLVYATLHKSLSYSQMIIFFITSVITSILFPLVVIIKKKRSILNIDFIFSLSAFFGGLIISVLFVETGSRQYHGNFFWQNVITVFILFLVAVKHTIPDLTSPIKLKKLNIIQVAFFGHVIFGFLYILKILIFQSYT